MKTCLLLLLAVAACGSSAGEPSKIYGGDRPTTLQVPANLEPGKTYPLVMVLHGYGATSLLEVGVLGLQDLTTDPGVFVLAPDGRTDSFDKQYWNADDACCDMDHSGVDDVAYLGGLIDDVSADWPVDPKRVYLIGHSNGAWMAYRMACERADVVTAIAGLAGAATVINGWTCNPSQPVSVLHMHGTADDTVPYDGVPPEIPGAVASVEEWAGHDGCGTTRTTGAPLDLDLRAAGAETTTESTDGCPAGVNADLWSIQGVGHVPAVTPEFPHDVMGWLLAHSR